MHDDCSTPGVVVPCESCGYGYDTRANHVAGSDDCNRAKEQQAEPCEECGHGKYWHSEGFCIQAIAGNAKRLPGFCGMHKYKAQAES